MGFFAKLWNAVKGGNKEELESLRKEAVENIAEAADKAGDFAKDLSEKAAEAKKDFTEK